MNNYLTFYALTRIDHVHDLLRGISIALFIVTVIYFVLYGLMSVDDDDDCPTEKYKNFGKKYIKWFIILILTFNIIRTFLPTRNETIMILAGGKALDYVQTDSNLVKLPYQTTEFISKFLETEINELKK